jgi:integrase
MSERFSTRLACNDRLDEHVLPKWGDCPITDLEARPVELWLRGLKVSRQAKVHRFRGQPLSPKTLVHIRGLISQLWKLAIWSGYVPRQENPMKFVEIKDATLRKKPRSLTEGEFRKFAAHIEEPIRTLALLCVVFGLRISEVLALRWGRCRLAQRNTCDQPGYLSSTCG